MGRLSVAALLVVAACHRAPPPRIYTDADIAELEKRVLAKVADVDASCSHPELLAFTQSLSDECMRDVNNLRAHMADADSNEAADVDEKCAAPTLAAFGRAAATSPGCSPFQVGVRAEQVVPLVSLKAARILSNHAAREVDHDVALTELLVGVQVAQDLGRGRVDVIVSILAATMQVVLLGTAEKVLTSASLSREQLDDLAATLDALIASEPRFGDTLHGEALSTALHLGLAGLKPPSWQPPGGRGEMTLSTARRTHGKHDPRDDAAYTMALALEMDAFYARACPPSASHAECAKGLGPYVEPSNDPDLVDRQVSRLIAFPGDATRKQSQQELLDAGRDIFVGPYLVARARLVARMAALRLRVEVLRDGQCPTDAELATAPYSTLRTPGVLGDALVVSRHDDVLVVDAPAWTRDGKYAKSWPITIPCP